MIYVANQLLFIEKNTWKFLWIKNWESDKEKNMHFKVYKNQMYLPEKREKLIYLSQSSLTCMLKCATCNNTGTLYI